MKRGARGEVCWAPGAALAFAAASLLLWTGLRVLAARPAGGEEITQPLYVLEEPLAALRIDYPSDGSIFPPDFAPPTFVWTDFAPSATAWMIEIKFNDGSGDLRIRVKGDPLSIGEIDQRCLGPPSEIPTLTPEQKAARTWKPDAATWTTIKRRTVGTAARLLITGIREEGNRQVHAVSRGSLTFQTARDPVGAPIFYRDVPLRLPGESVDGRSVRPLARRGIMQPLPITALPLVEWRLRYVEESQSRLVLTGMPTCVNCHSFSADGKTLAMDLDGPMNDKGLYAIAPVKPQMQIRAENVIEWSSFRETAAPGTRVGLLSRISPDGRYVITTVRREDFVANYADLRFLQAAYPTRGILAWYCRSTGEMKTLPGADDPRYVHTGADWTPDGKYVIFARAEAKDAYVPGMKPAEFAGDPNDVRIQYDLYRIPFNEGRGGLAEPIPGASQNGMSNYFPRVSPDGRWIVFVRAQNAQFLRPDSELYIIPAQGGLPRRMRCNGAVMNSWHSFSPNGRWMVFSSKRNTPYTQLFLTHIDEEGNDSPALLIENSTAANRAANLPEFVNISSGGLISISVPAVSFNLLSTRALQNTLKGEYSEAIKDWQEAITIDPRNTTVRNNLALALALAGRLEEAEVHYRKILEILPDSLSARNNLANILYTQGKEDEAIEQWRAALRLNPHSPSANNNLAQRLYSRGQCAEAVKHWRVALGAEPDRLSVLARLSWALATCPDPSVRNGAEAVALATRGQQLSEGRDPEILSSLAAAYAETGRFAEAVVIAKRARTLAAEQRNAALAQSLAGWIELYESNKPVRSPR
ncbi:MAG: tetratricopeptide repeat protein [Bryobacteraceae bacterium]